MPSISLFNAPSMSSSSCPSMAHKTVRATLTLSAIALSAIALVGLIAISAQIGQITPLIQFLKPLNWKIGTALFVIAAPLAGFGFIYLVVSKKRAAYPQKNEPPKRVAEEKKPLESSESNSSKRSKTRDSHQPSEKKRSSKPSPSLPASNSLEPESSSSQERTVEISTHPKEEKAKPEPSVPRSPEQPKVNLQPKETHTDLKITEAPYYFGTRTREESDYLLYNFKVMKDNIWLLRYSEKQKSLVISIMAKKSSEGSKSFHQLLTDFQKKYPEIYRQCLLPEDTMQITEKQLFDFIERVPEIQKGDDPFWTHFSPENAITKLAPSQKKQYSSQVILDLGAGKTAKLLTKKIQTQNQQVNVIDLKKTRDIGEEDLKGIDQNSRVYLIGHCGPGSPFLWDDNKNEYRAKYFAQLLKRSGSFRVKNETPLVISVIACWGAEEGPEGQSSFCEQLSRYLDKEGIHAVVYGRAKGVMRGINIEESMPYKKFVFMEANHQGQTLKAGITYRGTHTKRSFHTKGGACTKEWIH